MAQRMDFTKLKNQLENSCLKIEGCGKCDDGNCCLNYSKTAIATFEKKRLRLIPKGMSNIPSMDTKVYNNDELIDAVAQSLVLCKQCKENHEKECVINVTRASLERILFGDNVEDYKGTILQHLMELTSVNSEIGNSIMESYQKIKSI